MAWVEIKYRREMKEEQLPNNRTAYYSDDGWKMSREDFTNNQGMLLEQTWVLRDNNGTALDYDQYRYDLEARCNLRLIPIIAQEWRSV